MNHIHTKIEQLVLAIKGESNVVKLSELKARLRVCEAIVAYSSEVDYV